MKIISILLLHLMILGNAVSQSQSRTKVIMLGTGNPNPDPGHSGCSIAVVVDENSYLIDFGPGLIRQATAMSPRYGGNVGALSAKNLKKAFLTHLHSDHTTGYPDLILTPWVMGRDEPLEVYGPEGIKEMTYHILEAYREDIRYRLYGAEPANNKGWRVNAHEISEGIIYEDNLIKVEAFPVIHGSWPNAFGFRFTTPDKVIVISGDARPSEKILEYAQNADILIHEVYYKKGYDTKSEFWRNYHALNHTSTYELGEIANKIQPGLIILYHTLYWGGTDEDILGEIGEVYRGNVVVGEDLKIYE